MIAWMGCVSLSLVNLAVGSEDTGLELPLEILLVFFVDAYMRRFKTKRRNSYKEFGGVNDFTSSNEMWGTWQKY